jgi:hypothetical protein
MNNKSLNTRVIAVGDVHGEYDVLQRILLHAKLADSSGHWTGGNAILVQTGDVIDRGPKSLESVDLIRSLQEQAIRSGGKVVRLLGNHELMLLQDNHSYANFERPEELAEAIKKEIADKKVQAAWTDGKRLFSHAGVRTRLREWFEGGKTSPGSGQFPPERLRRIANAANDGLVQAVVSDDYKGPHFYIDGTRGGGDPFGGIFWGDACDLVGSINAFEMPQVFGHTITGKPAFQLAYGRSLINIDCGMRTGYGGNCGYLEITPRGELIGHTKSVKSQEFKSRPISRNGNVSG